MSYLVRFTALLGLMLLMGCNRVTSSTPNLRAVESEASSEKADDFVAPATVKVENPHYRLWAKHPVGTTVAVREKTELPGTASETITTYKLKQRSDEQVVVEVDGEIKTPDGKVHSRNTQDMTYSRWLSVPEERAKRDLLRPIGTVESRTDSLTLLGREYLAKWYKSKGRVEAGETLTETWIVEELPGGIARSIHSIPASKKTVTAEIIRINNN